MNSEYDITLHSDETSSPGMARERFLDSLGLGEIPPAEPEMTESAEVEDSADESGDEGVVLSSQPDDLESPAVDSESGQRTLSYSLGSSSERTRTVAISITPKDRIVDPAAEAAGPIPDKTTNLDENLTLACPECHGELVLQRHHLGIEGLCVWCHTPIIAAESARDSIVRVFPVLGRITKPFTAPATAADPAIVEAKEEVAETVVEVEAPAPDPEVEPEAVAPVETAAPAPAEEVEATVPEPTSFSPEAFSFGPPPVMAPVSMTSLPAAPPAFADSTAASAGFSHVKEEVSPFDLDALYATSSFRESDEESDLPSAGFGETIADSTLAGSPDTEVSGTGFGAFLQSTPPATPAPTAAPLAESWSNPAAAATATAHEAAGFSVATPWGPPSKPAADTTAPLPLASSAAPTAANDDAPVSLPTDFASGFGSPASAPSGLPAAIEDTGSVDAPWASAFEEAAPADATTAPSPVDDFADAFPTGGFGNLTAPSDLGSFTAPGEPNPAFAAAPLSNDFAAGFQATGFGAPAPTPAATPAAANEPALASPATPVDDFAAAFASAGFGSPAATPAPVESMKSATGVSSFPETASAPAAASLPVVETAETPEFTFQTSPASKLLFGDDGADEKRSFAMPGHGFSTGSSSESESKPTLFPDVPATGTGTPATGWGISEPIGFSSPDDAPVPLSSGPAFVPGAGVSQVPSPEESPFPPLTGSSFPASIEKPVSLFSEAAPAMVSSTPAPIPPTMPTPENVSAAPAAPKLMPPLPQTQEPTFSSIANPIEASAPNVVSEPLGSKPKPKVRKGFIVLMVVIVGFAAGAALASFVLPIDEYVQTARALMEQKFNSGSSVQQIPAMPLTAGEAVNPAVEP